MLAARAVPPVRRELVNRRRKRDISVFLSDDRIWIAFPEENRGHFLIVPHLGNRVYGRVKLGKNPLVGLRRLPGMLITSGTASFGIACPQGLQALAA